MTTLTPKKTIAPKLSKTRILVQNQESTKKERMKETVAFLKITKPKGILMTEIKVHMVKSIQNKDAKQCDTLCLLNLTGNTCPAKRFCHLCSFQHVCIQLLNGSLARLSMSVQWFTHYTT